MEDTQILDQIVDTILNEHHYGYRNFEEAKHTITIQTPPIQFVYDRLSLYIYHHNLSKEGYDYVRKHLCTYFDSADHREDYKASCEYNILLHLHFLSSICAGSSISKETRPDFILSGAKRIGIEVTELTTPFDSIQEAICKANFGQGKTANEIHASALQKHGQKANTYTYQTICGSAVIGSGLQDINANKDIYRDEIIKKWNLYANMIPQFDQFIILCDGRSPIGITSHWDADDIMDRVRDKCPDIKNCTVCILYLDNEDNSLQAANYNF